MKICLRSGRNSAIVNTMGAFVDSWQREGEDVLFPKQMLAGKNRGGVPVCAPTFGPGDAVGLNQHGYARDSQWSIIKQSESEVKLRLDSSALEGLPADFRGCVMDYEISLTKDSLELLLTIKNQGHQSFVCSPGFHPYFPTIDASAVEVNGFVYNDSQLINTQYFDSSLIKFHLRKFKVLIESSGLTIVAVWSAAPDKFICIEPTSGGNLDDQAELDLLAPGEERIYGARITII